MIIIFSLFFSSLLCSNCTKDSLHPQLGSVDMYLDFERSVEPFQKMPSRLVNSEAVNNGCLNPVAWNQYYNFNVCIASTCDVSDYAIERSDRFARQGSSSVRFYLRPTPLDKWPLGEASHRAELGPSYEAPLNRYPKEGEERWYGLSVLMPEDFVFAPPNLENELRFSIAQWQHGSEGSPALALEVYGNKLAIARSVGESLNSTWVEPQFIGKISPGKWMDLVIQVKWDKKDGIIRAWYNGEKTYDQKDIQTVYENLSVGGGLKLGIYYWRWREKDSVRKSLENGIKDREIYIDEVREFIGSDGLLAVTPGQSF